jgi:hypothetical protein
LKLIASSNNDANVQSTQFEKQAKIIEVSIVKFGLVVPFDLHAHAVLEAIDLMRRAIDDVFVNPNLRLKFPFSPSPRGECAIYRAGHLALAATADRNVSLAEAKGRQDSNDIIPFLAKVSPQNCRSVAPLMNVVILSNELREIDERYRADLLGLRFWIQL